MKKGTKVRVVNNDHAVEHGFKIGEEVECTGERSMYTGNYSFTNKAYKQWLHPSCYEPIKKPKTREQLEKKIAKLTKQLEGLEEEKYKSGWYKNLSYSKCMVYYDFEEKRLYGINRHGTWFDYLDVDSIDEGDIPAAEEEVFEALKAEAIKRGFKEGVRINNCNIYNGKSCSDWTIRNHDFIFKNNILRLSAEIFNNGEWAEIITTPTLNGKEVKVTSDTVTIGCEEFGKISFEVHLNYIDNIGITSLTHPELGEIKINDLKELIK